MSLTPGETIGAYRIVEQIGRGGMATVYKAHQATVAGYSSVIGLDHVRVVTVTRVSVYGLAP